MKTSELTGLALDWAVASIELTGHDDYTNVLMVTVGDDNDWKYNPSGDWMQGGPIIERENISIVREGDAGNWVASVYNYAEVNWHLHTEGTTPLIAAMRCYVASKLGDEVETPKGLTS
jgi:hypothetical protein